jgi:D-alanyl-D-alanine dipeptidase
MYNHDQGGVLVSTPATCQLTLDASRLTVEAHTKVSHDCIAPWVHVTMSHTTRASWKRVRTTTDTCKSRECHADAQPSGWAQINKRTGVCHHTSEHTVASV